MASNYRKAYEGYCKKYNKNNPGGYGDQDWPDSYDKFREGRIQEEVLYGKKEEKKTKAYIKKANQDKKHEHKHIQNSQSERREQTKKYDNAQNSQTGSYIKEFATGIVIGTVAAGFFNTTLAS